MIPLSDNCEFFLGRDADVQVITEFDQKRAVWKAHAVHFLGTRRMAIATGLGKNCVQAMSALHHETARKVGEFGILQAQHCRVYEPDSEETAGFEAKSSTDINPSDWDDVISLGSDDEEGSMKTPATVPVQASIPEMTPFRTIQRSPQAASFPARRGSGRMSCMDAGEERTHVVQETQRVLKRSGIVYNASPPPPPPPPPPPSTTAMRLASSIPSHSAGDVCPQAIPHSPADTANYALRIGVPSPTVRALGLGYHNLPHKSEFVSAGARSVVITVTWKGHNGVSRGQFSCPMHTSVLKNLACILAIHQSNSLLNIGQHRTLSDMEQADYLCDDNQTCLVASIKQMRQGDRLVPSPSSPSDIARLFTTWGDVPEIDIEVEQMQLPDFGCPPGQVELQGPREKLDPGEVDFSAFQSRIPLSGPLEDVDLSPHAGL